jgi:hypothetical protein
MAVPWWRWWGWLCGHFCRDLAEPVVAFSSSGTFDPDPGNPLFAFLTRDMPQRVQEAQQVETEITARKSGRTSWANQGKVTAAGHQRATTSKTKWDHYRAKGAKAAGLWSDYIEESAPSWGGAASISDVRVSPLIQSRWNQMTAQGVACYNYYCPPGPDGSAANYYAGCVATMMGQIFATGRSGRRLRPRLRLHQRAAGPRPPICGPVAIGRPPRLRHLGQYEHGAAVLRRPAHRRNAFTNIFGYAAPATPIAPPASTPPNALILRSSLAGHYPVSVASAARAVIRGGRRRVRLQHGVLYYHVNMGWGGTSDAWYNLPTIDGAYTYDTVDALVYNIFVSGGGELLAGRVTDSTGAALAGATITATTGGPSYSATSDSNGYYAVKVPSSASYTVTASKGGYQSSACRHRGGQLADVDHYYDSGSATGHLRTTSAPTWRSSFDHGRRAHQQRVARSAPERR